VTGRRLGSAAGLLLLVVVVYTLGVLSGRMWIDRGGETAPPSVQTPAAGQSDTCRYYQDLITWHEADQVVKRRGVETFCE
jgi:hypothetical protein